MLGSQVTQERKSVRDASRARLLEVSIASTQQGSRVRIPRAAETIIQTIRKVCCGVLTPQVPQEETISYTILEERCFQSS